jgi:hemolysin III
MEKNLPENRPSKHLSSHRWNIYTHPLLGLKGAWGWAMFGVIWGMALIGFIFKFSPLRNNLSLSLYALMGSTAIIAIKPMIENLSNGALIFYHIGRVMLYFWNLFL